MRHQIVAKLSKDLSLKVSNIKTTGEVSACSDYSFCKSILFQKHLILYFMSNFWFRQLLELQEAPLDIFDPRELLVSSRCLKSLMIIASSLNNRDIPTAHCTFIVVLWLLLQLLEQMPSVIVALDSHLDSAIRRYLEVEVVKHTGSSALMS